ncbi:MAG: hypothetical protein ACI3ZY_13330 [Parabacteroides sp.]
MKTNLFLLGALTLLFAACQDELQQSDNKAWGVALNHLVSA